MNKASAKGYGLIRESANYEHLTIKVLEDEWCGGGNPYPKEVLSFKWQGDRGGEWYGFEIETAYRSTASFEKFAHMAKLVARIAKSIEGKATPAGVVLALDELGYDRHIVDPRTSYWVLADEVYPDDYHCWMMDYRASGLTSNEGVNVMARDLESAQREWLRRMMGEERHLYRDAEHRLDTVTKWQAAGRPMVLHDFYPGRKPDRRSITELASLLPAEVAVS